MPVPPELRGSLSEHTVDSLAVTRTLASYLTLEDTVAAKYDPRTTEHIMHTARRAGQIHADQHRANRIPYAIHIFEVARIATDLCNEPIPEITLAGLFHDSPEDRAEEFLREHEYTLEGINNPQDDALKAIQVEYGPTTARIIRGVTNPNFELQLLQEDVEPGTPEYIERKHQLYREHVAKAIDDPLVFIVKVADFMHNTAGIKDLPKSMRQHFLDKYLPLVEVYRIRLHDTENPIPTDQADGIEAHFQELEQYALSELA